MHGNTSNDNDFKLIMVYLVSWFSLQCPLVHLIKSFHTAEMIAISVSHTKSLLTGLQNSKDAENHCISHFSIPGTQCLLPTN